MPAITPNVALGRVNELARRINANDPANSVFVIVWLVSSASLEDFRDCDTLADVLAVSGTSEATHTGYSRRILDNTASITVTVDDSGDLQVTDFPNQLYEDVQGDDDDVKFAVLGYDANSTSGSDSDIVPCTVSDFAVSPNGGDVTLVVATGGAFVAADDE